MFKAENSMVTMSLISLASDSIRKFQYLQMQFKDSKLLNKSFLITEAKRQYNKCFVSFGITSNGPLKLPRKLANWKKESLRSSLKTIINVQIEKGSYHKEPCRDMVNFPFIIQTFFHTSHLKYNQIWLQIVLIYVSVFFVGFIIRLVSTNQIRIFGLSSPWLHKDIPYCT